MLQAFHKGPRGLDRLPTEAPLEQALWIDVTAPTEAELAELSRLGPDIPTLTEMEEIEISNRLYREEGADFLTVVLPLNADTAVPSSVPVTFILQQERLITVRHHSPRPFETFPVRADKSASGCGSAERVFLGLTEEVVGRLADILEGVGRSLDHVMRDVLGGEGMPVSDLLQQALEQTGRQGDLIGRVRLGLLTMERAMSYFGQRLAARNEGAMLDAIVKGHMRDIKALEVHADFLSQRVSLAVDATLGMINLSQNVTVRIVSVVAVLFLPPTLIASIYGMNFHAMPELHWAWGYPVALVVMVASAIGTYLFFKWRNWL